MGEAKRRGTFEERKAQATERDKAEAQLLEQRQEFEREKQAEEQRRHMKKNGIQPKPYRRSSLLLASVLTVASMATLHDGKEDL